ncbi:MAG: DUF692 domain-containing protein [Chloroflexi bacterium]|nr:DUF692 domain-containing protein [Chloroflexota bacterium]MBV9597967.1 DUF692 domain-containing protein [Chloroflexota bacterium]
MFDQIPFLGAGLGYQHDLHAEILANRAGIDFLEVPTDQFLREPDWSTELMEIKDNFPTVAHGIYMSLGDAAGPHLDYLDRLAPYIDSLDPVLFSDHIDMGNIPDDDLGKYFHGMQVPFTAEQAEVFRRNMHLFQSRIGRPLLVENLFYNFVLPMPGSLPEPVFIGEILKDTEFGLLLDVTNIYLNSLNQGFDPYEWLDQAPLERTVQVHVAGGEQARSGPRAGEWSDTHSRPVPDAVWRMLEYALQRAPAKGILLERDQDYPPIEELLDELSIARQLMKRNPSTPVSPEGR